MKEGIKYRDHYSRCQLHRGRLCNPMDRSPPGPSDFPGRKLEWVAMAFSRETSLLAQMVKRLPPMRETWVRSLGWEDPLEKEKNTHSSIALWRIPWTIHGVTNSWTRLSDFHLRVARKARSAIVPRMLAQHLLLLLLLSHFSRVQLCATP